MIDQFKKASSLIEKIPKEYGKYKKFLQEIISNVQIINTNFNYNQIYKLIQKEDKILIRNINNYYLDHFANHSLLLNSIDRATMIIPLPEHESFIFSSTYINDNFWGFGYGINKREDKKNKSYTQFFYGTDLFNQDGLFFINSLIYHAVQKSIITRNSFLLKKEKDFINFNIDEYLRLYLYSLNKPNIPEQIPHHLIKNAKL